jgi:hypothetical protein
MVEENEKVECPDCENGHTPAGWALRKITQLIMIAGEDGGKGRSPHPWLKAVGIEALSPDMAELSSALAGRSATRPGGHDSIDAWEATKKIVGASGLSPSWGLCKTCSGSGEV